jgi:hypothetical protein
MNDETENSIASGLCECGCGEATTIAQRTDHKRGWVKGKPIRFRKGHNHRKGFKWAACSTGYGTPCWIWQGAKTRNGYGVTTVSGTSTLAHRAFYMMFVGPIPPGLQLDHLCQVRPCVNPEHLEPVTATVNVRRSSVTKLTPNAVAEIRATPATQTTLAAQHGVTQGHVSRIKNNLTWREEEPTGDRVSRCTPPSCDGPAFSSLAGGSPCRAS